MWDQMVALHSEIIQQWHCIGRLSNSRRRNLAEERSSLGVHFAGFVFSICVLCADEMWPTSFLLLPLCHIICEWVILILWNSFFITKLLLVMIFYDSNRKVTEEMGNRGWIGIRCGEGQEGWPDGHVNEWKSASNRVRQIWYMCRTWQRSGIG